MPKMVQELNNFNVGTMTTPDVRDIPAEAASYSLDLDSVVEDGLLRGVPADAVFVTDDSTNATTMDAYVTGSIQRTATEKDIIYYQNTGNNLKVIKALEDTNGGETVTIESGIVSSGDEVCMETNNREVHVGTGSDSTDVPKWVGYIDYGQFGGTAPAEDGVNAPVIEDAELKSLEGFPAFYKTVGYNDGTYEYVYGIDFQGSRIYRVRITGGLVVESSSVFDSLQGLCVDNSTAHLWVYDAGVGQEGAIYKIDIAAGNDDMNIVQTNMLIDSLDNIIVDASDNVGILTDMINIGGTLWFSAWVKYGATILADSGACKWLYKLTEPTVDGDVTLSEMTPTWESAEVYSQDDTDPAGAANMGKWCGGTGLSAGPTLRTFHTPLCTITGSSTQVGCLIREEHTGTGSSGRTWIGNNKVDGTNHYNIVKFHNGSTYLDNVPVNVFIVVADNSASTDASRYLQSDGFAIENLWVSAASSGWDTANFNSLDNGSQKLFISYSSTSLAIWDDIATATLANGSTNAAYNVVTMATTTKSINNNSKASISVFSDDSTNTSLMSANGLGGGRLERHTYTHGTGALSAATAISRGGITIVPTATASTDGAFLSTKKYFYAVSFVYDGYQESPLTSKVQITPGSASNMDIEIHLRKLSVFPKRVSHVNLYRGESADTTSGEPDGFMRLVRSFPVTAEWTSAADDYWEEDSSDVYRKRVYSDNQSLGASYDAINGMSETIDQSIVNYALSTTHMGHHVVAKCYHKDLPNAERYVFKSKPNKFDQFNWTTDFVRLPTIPTAIASFKGRVYAWGSNHTYVINMDGMYVEDVYEGIGCIGHQAFKVTDAGMCFADETNIYLHDGRQAQAISELIKGGDAVPRPTNLAGSSVTSLDVSWEAKASTGGANKAAICVEFDSKRSSFLIFWSHADSSDPSRAYCWAYNLPRKRWDLWSVTTSSTSSYVRTTFQDSKGNIYYSDGTNCYKFLGGSTRKRYEYMTKLLSMQQHTQPKKFHGWELRYKRSTTSEAAAKYPLVYWSLQNGTVWTHGTHAGDFGETSNTQNSNTTYTHMQGKLRVSNGGAAQTQEARDIKFFIQDNVESDGTTIAATEVDSLGVVFRPSRKAARTVTY